MSSEAFVEGRDRHAAVPRDLRPLWAALAVGAAYYGGARIGLALTFDPFPLSVLWPPNALLLACLLLAPTRWWWLLIAAAFPAHLLAELQSGVPRSMVLCWFVSNVTEALVGALFIRRFVRGTPGLDTVHAVVVFLLAALIGPFLSSFLDAAFVRWIGWRDADYWSLWHARLFSNMLATLTFVPVVLSCASIRPAQLRDAGPIHLLEGAALLLGLLAVSVIAFDTGLADPDSVNSLLYLPVPFLLWAALRFGPQMTSVAFTVVAFSVIWGAGHGRGPFLLAAAHDNAFPIQLFLITVAVPLLLLAAMLEERRRAERRLRASEDLFSSAFRASPDAMAISRRRDGRVIEANDRWLDLLGYQRQELARGLVEPLAAHVSATDRDKLLALERPGAALRDEELALRDRRGIERQTLVRVNAVEMRGEACVISIVRDITAQRQAERREREHRQQLTHLTRVASLTDFSSTVAHELKQPLMAILANAQAAQMLLERDSPDLPEIRVILEEIAEADKRAGLLIHHLRLLMKRGDEEFAPVHLNQVVRDVLHLLHGEFVSWDIEVRTDLSPEVPPVDGDRVQLEQLVLNLVSNACDAMHGLPPGHATLKITTAHADDGRVHLVVNDSGPGIPADQIDSVFEPFFTTKSNGIGLGLPISHKIALAHGGDLRVEPGAGDGATLRVVLPATGTRGVALA